MRGLKEKDELYAEIADDGAMHVEKPLTSAACRASGSSPTPQAEGIHGKATRNAAAHVLARELACACAACVAAKPDAFKLDARGPDPVAGRGDRAAWRRATIR